MKTFQKIASRRLSDRANTLRSADGNIAFHLVQANGELFVERIEDRQGHARITKSALFSNAASFRRWCDADSVRFDYPVVYVALKHDGDALLGSG